MPSAARLTRLLEAALGAGADAGPRAALEHLVAGAAELTGAAHACLVPPPDAPEDVTGVRADRAPAGDAHPAHRLRVPVRAGDEQAGELCLAGRTDGRPFGAGDERVLRVLAAQAGLVIGNARLSGTARQHARWLRGAAAVTAALLTGRTDDALLAVAERARLLAGASAGVILQPTAEGGMEIVTATAPDDPDGLVGAVITPGSPVLEQLLGGEPVFVDDSATDPRMTTRVRHRFGPSMMLPLRAEGRLIGTLALPRRRGDRPYTGVEKLLATRFASQAALALVLADARRGRARLAVYEDRDRIARDLHDLVVQRLFATGMTLESILRRPDAGDVRDLLVRAVEELRSTVQEVRTAIFALRQPPADPPAGLRGRVLRETATAAALLGFPPATRFTGPVDSVVPDEAAEHLLTALRRALAGVVRRRPGVTRVEVTVEAGGGRVRLTVRDDDAGGTTVRWESPL
ncbi:sensor histidine kinase [Streptomyces fumanus]|uniref:sensor histidine kinase n=1 Tax=Streptomyces fumanus TaxID=67302 RepID=UPI0033DF494A